MASFTTSNVPTNKLVSRELSIASSFVRQYYTILNKAPCYIHNFYSHDSTFIHGTIEMASEHYTEPVVGREKIKRKMEDLNLNDCRAKIKQIDCLETLAGGFVIQVIGELSNNGMPMRKFLQTFVLAPSPNESRQDIDSQQQPHQNVRAGQAMGGPVGNSAARGVQLSGENNNSSSHNQKFYVLNEIFRYQDDGPANEFGGDPESLHADSSVDNTNNGNMSEMNNPDPVAVDNQQQQQPQQQQPQPQPQQQQQQAPSNVHVSNSNGAAVPEYGQNRRVRLITDTVVKGVEFTDGAIAGLEEGLKITKISNIETSANDSKARDSGGPKVVSNGTGNSDKKNETSEKQSTENGKTNVDSQSQAIASSNFSSTQSANQQQHQQPAPITTATRPQPSSEPKTWANMVRNAHPPSASSVQVNVNKPQPTEQQLQNATQTSSIHHPHQQQQQQQQSQQQQQQQSQQQQSQQLQPQQQQSQNNRRRHMMRKPSNKSTGRSMKNRPPRPPQATSGTKPVA